MGEVVASVRVLPGGTAREREVRTEVGVKGKMRN